jgi:hypothetical protein
MKAIFNWKNIYSKENAKIVEMLLDKKIVPFVEIIEIFFPNDQSKSDINSYLMHLIQPGLIDRLTHNDMTLLFNLPLEYFTYEYFYLWFAQMWEAYYIATLNEAQSKVYADKILSLMIDNGVLPAQICRLPRLNKEQIGFDVIPDYYEKQWDYNSTTDDEIVFHVKNYCTATPLTLTYSEAISRVSQSGHPQSLIKTHAKDKKLPVYLQVPEDSVINDSQMKRLSRQSIEYFRESNCGNPSYSKRYNGLERLTQSSINTLFDGKTIRIKDNEHCMRKLAVQTTEIETKYHLQRYIKSCIQIAENGLNYASNDFQLKDTVYLLEDIEVLIICSAQDAQRVQVTNEEIYNGIELTQQEISILWNEIPNETAPERNQRIKDMTDRHKKSLEQQFKRTLAREPIIKAIHSRLELIYRTFNKELPSPESCLANDRQLRRKSKILQE